MTQRTAAVRGRARRRGAVEVQPNRRHIASSQWQRCRIARHDGGRQRERPTWRPPCQGGRRRLERRVQRRVKRPPQPPRLHGRLTQQYHGGCAQRDRDPGEPTARARAAPTEPQRHDRKTDRQRREPQGDLREHHPDRPRLPHRGVQTGHGTIVNSAPTRTPARQPIATTGRASRVFQGFRVRGHRAPYSWADAARDAGAVIWRRVPSRRSSSARQDRRAPLDEPGVSRRITDRRCCRAGTAPALDFRTSPAGTVAPAAGYAAAAGRCVRRMFIMGTSKNLMIASIEVPICG